MKLAWLVWDFIEDKDAGLAPELWTTEPECWRVYVQIVYAEVV